MKFSKALFKQCIKTNGMSWLIITVLECVMVASIMAITGGDSIGVLIGSIRNSILQGAISSYVSEMSLNFYNMGTTAEVRYDSYFKDDFLTTYNEVSPFASSLDSWYLAKPVASDYGTEEEYQSALSSWNTSIPTTDSTLNNEYKTEFVSWLAKEGEEETSTWLESKPSDRKFSKVKAREISDEKLFDYFNDYAKGLGYGYYTDDWILIMQAGTGPICPMDQVIEMYERNNIEILPSYDVDPIIDAALSGTFDSFTVSEERMSYRSIRSREAASIMAGCTLTATESVSVLLSMIEDYGIDEETYYSFGYTFESVKKDSASTIIAYEAQYTYQLSLLEEQRIKEGWDEEKFNEELVKMEETLSKGVTGSFLSSLPENVSGAIEEIGRLDLYGLIVGYIFYKIAGLLLPMIYMVLSINNMVAGAVDSGSMAYTLCTGTKREDVAITQGSFMILSLLGMFLATGITSASVYSIMHSLNTNITLFGVILMNLGAFLVLFALSGFCFAISCFFNRSRSSLAIGGGLTIFALVATIVGLFGSEIVPSIIRFDALNYFNYVSIISLFDIMDITRNSPNIYWKLAILLVIGIAGYIIGTLKFKKKDLPL